MLTLKEALAKHDKFRENVRSMNEGSTISDLALLHISESLDIYIEHRIETDKVLVGILKDIQGDMASRAEMDWMMNKLREIFEKNEIPLT